MTKERIVAQYQIGNLNYYIRDPGIKKTGWSGYSVWRNGGMIEDRYVDMRTAELAILEDAKQWMMDELAEAVASVASTHTLLMELGSVKWPAIAKKYGVKNPVVGFAEKKRKRKISLCKAWPRCACIAQGTDKD